MATPRPTSGPTNGTLTLNADGSFTYTPNANFNGTDTFTYKVTNGAQTSATAATVSITVTAVNDPPTAVADSKTATEDTALSFPATDLTANDSPGPANESGQTLTVTAVSATSTAGGAVTLVSGTVTYTPPANFNGSDSFTYTVQDNGVTNGIPDPKTATGTANVTVTEVNDAPTANNDTKTAAEDTPLSFPSADLTANDSAGPANESGQTLTVTAVSATSTAGGAVTLVSGTITYTPPADFSGSDSFTYTVQDNGTTSGAPDPKTATATVNITVTEVNDPPTANPDPETTPEDTALSFAASTLTSNDSAGPANESGQILTVTAVSATSTAGGTVSLAAGTITYTPPANFNGSDSFTYTVQDNGTTNGASDPKTATGTVNVTVTEVNDPPTANPDPETTPEDTALSFAASNLTANDSAGPPNESGQTLTVTAVSATSTAGGTVSLVAGTITYTPPANFNGPDSFTYTVQDNGTTNGAADPKGATGTVSVTVTEVNDPPTANNDTATTPEDTPITINVAANDSAGPANEASQTLTVSSVSVNGNTHGTVTYSNGSVTYTPDLNYNGPASFGYTICDNGTTAGAPATLCASASVSITVTPVNDPPVVTSLIAAPGTISENDTVTLNGSFADPDIGDTHTVTINWGDGSTDTLPVLAAGVLSFGATHKYLDDNPTGTASDSHTVTVTVSDAGSPPPVLTGSAQTIVTVQNVAPTINTVAVPADPQQVGTAVNVTINFSLAIPARKTRSHVRSRGMMPRPVPARRPHRRQTPKPVS